MSSMEEPLVCGGELAILRDAAKSMGYRNGREVDGSSMFEESW
jgi:hypothetical protein